MIGKVFKISACFAFRHNVKKSQLSKVFEINSTPVFWVLISFLNLICLVVYEKALTNLTLVYNLLNVP